LLRRPRGAGVAPLRAVGAGRSHAAARVGWSTAKSACLAWWSGSLNADSSALGTSPCSDRPLGPRRTGSGPSLSTAHPSDGTPYMFRSKGEGIIPMLRRSDGTPCMFRSKGERDHGELSPVNWNIGMFHLRSAVEAAARETRYAGGPAAPWEERHERGEGSGPRA
jgi:hypothetical protein